MSSRADLHVHSKYSNRPSEWFLRRIGAPESYVEPMDIYRRARERGMSYVTITDHNKISGALDIAHLPATFVSCELTTYFPEDQVKVHLLVYDITESQFEELSILRKNIYELRAYLLNQGIIHSLAHPLFRVDGHLSGNHVEKLLLLFNRFEGINGSRDPRSADLFQLICGSLTPKFMSLLADKHGLFPGGEKPWIKTFTGGSDDHSGSFIAGAYTQTPAAGSLEEFLEHLRTGRHQACGSSGSSLKLAHSLYKIAYSYYKDRFGVGSGPGNDLLGELLKKLLDHQPAGKSAAGRKRVYHFCEKMVFVGRRRQLSPVEKMVVDEISRLFSHSVADALSESAQERSFESSCRLCHHLTWKFAHQFILRLREGKFLDALQTVAALGPVALSVAPYLAAFSTQHKDDNFLDDLTRQLIGNDCLTRTDHKMITAGNVYGSCEQMGAAIDRLVACTEGRYRQAKVLACCHDSFAGGRQWIRLQPVAHLEIDEDYGLSLPLPPFLDVFRLLEELGITEVVVATPELMGITVLAGARLLKIKSVFYYNQAFLLQYQNSLKETDFHQLTNRFLAWLADMADEILIEKEEDRQQLIDNGVASKKITLVAGERTPVLQAEVVA